VTEHGLRRFRRPGPLRVRALSSARLLRKQTVSQQVFSMDDFPRPPFPEQQQPVPGTTDKMNPRPDHGEDRYKGSARLKDKKVLITGGDSGIGRPWPWPSRAKERISLYPIWTSMKTPPKPRRLVVAPGRTCVLTPGDIGKAAHCRALVDRAVQAFGRIDVLVNNAASIRILGSLPTLTTHPARPYVLRCGEVCLVGQRRGGIDMRGRRHRGPGANRSQRP
jgi:hypothetical protein